VCDSEFDDEKTFDFIVEFEEEFIRLCHNRTLLLRGREVLLEELVPTIRCPVRFDAYFKVGGRWRKCLVQVGYRKVWLKRP
jgi:hypothetical protein